MISPCWSLRAVRIGPVLAIYTLNLDKSSIVKASEMRTVVYSGQDIQWKVAGYFCSSHNFNGFFTLLLLTYLLA